MCEPIPRTPKGTSRNRVVETTPAAVVPEVSKQPRGILKQADPSLKKRRVVFAGSDEQRSSSSGEENDKPFQVTGFIFYFDIDNRGIILKLV